MLDTTDATIMENNELETVKIESLEEPKKEIEATSVPISNKGKRNNKDEKSKKKDDRSIEQILKSLNGFETPEEKLTALCKKYIEILDDNRKLQMTLKQTEKKVLMNQREKEQYQSEKSKAVLTRSRLESLCRELQRQNKAIKEESLLKIREEEEKRKEVTAKFQSTLTEITALMAETTEKNVKLHEDNIEIHKKFKTVFNEIDIREQQHYKGMHQVMKHELQVAEAKLAKVTLDMTEEKEIILKERNALLMKLTEYQTKIHEFQQVEANLRSQINMYTDKYDEFQNALTKSNQVFEGFNEEMEKMSKKILKLEKETNLWKLRWEKSHAALLEMAADKQTKDSEIATLNRRCSLLQELCKVFQKDRATLLSQLKEKSGAPKSNEQTENNQQIDSTINILENPNIESSSLLDDLNAEIEEQTKESKTEVTCPLSEINKLDLVESSRENDKSANTKIANSEEVKDIDNVPVQEEEIQPTNSDINESIKQEESLTCESEEKVLQISVEVNNAINKETETSNNNEQFKQSVILENEKESNSITKDITDTTNIIKNLNELSVSNNLENDESKVCEIKNTSKVENQTQIQNANKVISNGENHSNPVTHKKHKEGKKKRK